MSFLSSIGNLLGLGRSSSSRSSENVHKLKASDRQPAVVEQLRVDFPAGSPLPPLGILKDMGYRVGKNGLLLHQRREILRRTFQVQLVSTSPWTKEYIREWGERCSPTRWDKMDRVLGGLVATAKRKTKVDMSEAIRNWEEDRLWLRNNRDWLNHTHG